MCESALSAPHLASQPSSCQLLSGASDMKVRLDTLCLSYRPALSPVGLGDSWGATLPADVQQPSLQEANC